MDLSQRQGDIYTTKVSGSCGSLTTGVLLSLSWPGPEGSALSASGLAFSVHYGVFMPASCFMMPVMTLSVQVGYPGCLRLRNLRHPGTSLCLGVVVD